MNLAEWLKYCSLFCSSRQSSDNMTAHMATKELTEIFEVTYLFCKTSSS